MPLHGQMVIDNIIVWADGDTTVANLFITGLIEIFYRTDCDIPLHGHLCESLGEQYNYLLGLLLTTAMLLNR